MKNKLFAIWFLILSLIYAQSFGSEIRKTELEVLKSLPDINEETRQWFIPSERGSWGGWVSYSAKEYLLYPILYNEKTNDYEIELFENKNLTGRKVVIRDGDSKYLNRRVMIFPNNKVCMYLPLAKYVSTKKWVECLRHSCKEVSVEKAQSVKLQDGKQMDWYEYSKDDVADKLSSCPEANGGFESVERPEPAAPSENPNWQEPIQGRLRTYFFTIKKLLPFKHIPNKVAEIDFGGNSYFLDLGFEHDLYFGNTKKKFSNYENDWLELQNKFHVSEPLIKSFFSRIKKEGVNVDFLTDMETSDFEFDNPKLFYKKKPQKISEDFIHEVNSCIEKMHLSGKSMSEFYFRGDKKICSIWIGQKPNEVYIKWVDYPEAFMNRLYPIVKLP